MSNRIISIVLNPFTNDSRVLKEVTSLKKAGYDVSVIALHEGNLKEKERINDIPIYRIRLRTRKLSKSLWAQVVKYIEFLLKVVIKYRNCQIVHCNDLNTLPVGVILKKLSKNKIKIVYDAHEYETEVKGLKGFRKKMAKFVERLLIKHADCVITVSNSIAEAYRRDYGIDKPKLVLNCPPYVQIQKKNIFREKFNIRPEQTIFLYQGGLVKGRGIEQLLEAFYQIKRDDVVLVLMGYGELENVVKEYAAKSNKIYFQEAVSPQILLEYSSSADIGVSIIEPSCLNYEYCLPNKFFEYSMVGLPILANNSVEMGKLVKQYNCGETIQSIDAKSINRGINNIMEKDIKQMSLNALKMAKRYNWEEQEKILLSVYREILK
jgi:glycosyltransferase involved in cell wall biosynthesis